MDVHPPHAPIHGLRDFFLHLFTITVGLLIALGLEALVEHNHQRHQREEARETIYAELTENRKSIDKLVPAIASQQACLTAMLGEIGNVRAHHPVPPAAHLSIAGASLRRSSYDTAITSGALALIPYTEASRFAEVYKLQLTFDSVQLQAILSAEAPLIGALPSPDRSLAGAEKLSPARLDALEDKINNYRGQLVMFSGASRELAGLYSQMPPH